MPSLETVIAVIIIFGIPILVIVLGDWLLVPFLEKYSYEIELVIVGLFALYGFYSFMKGGR